MTGWVARDGTIPALVFCMDERSFVSNNFFRLYRFFWLGWVTCFEGLKREKQGRMSMRFVGIQNGFLIWEGVVEC